MPFDPSKVGTWRNCPRHISKARELGMGYGMKPEDAYAQLEARVMAHGGTVCGYSVERLVDIAHQIDSGAIQINPHMYPKTQSAFEQFCQDYLVNARTTMPHDADEQKWAWEVIQNAKRLYQMIQRTNEGLIQEQIIREQHIMAQQQEHERANGLGAHGAQPSQHQWIASHPGGNGGGGGGHGGGGTSGSPGVPIPPPSAQPHWDMIMQELRKNPSRLKP